MFMLLMEIFDIVAACKISRVLLSAVACCESCMLL